MRRREGKGEGVTEELDVPRTRSRFSSGRGHYELSRGRIAWIRNWRGCYVHYGPLDDGPSVEVYESFIARSRPGSFLGLLWGGQFLWQSSLFLLSLFLLIFFPLSPLLFGHFSLCARPIQRLLAWSMYFAGVAAGTSLSHHHVENYPRSWENR